MIYGDEAINLLAASPIIGLIVRTLVSVPGVTRQRVWMSRRSNFAGIEPCRCQNRRKGGMPLRVVPVADHQFVIRFVIVGNVSKTKL